MTRVATYVFIDLETTGLPRDELNKTRITELSLVVVKRRHILDTRPGAAPRVQEKLTMCFNPRRMVDPGATETSGLCNDLLEYQTDFNLNVFNTINSFLLCHEKPVCLVAQNGHSFDFPILKNHFEKLGVSLSDDILCADSLHAFYDIFELGTGQDKSNKAGLSVIDNITTAVKSDVSFSDQNKDKITEEVIKKTDEQICNDSNIQSKEVADPLQDFDENNDLNNQQLSQQENERTPVRKPQLRKSVKKISKVRRKLYWGNNPQPALSYRLKHIYERVLGRPGIEAHRAENDCTMAMEISAYKAKQFVEWIDMDDNHCKFNEVNSMKLGVPLGD